MTLRLICNPIKYPTNILEKKNFLKFYIERSMCSLMAYLVEWRVLVKLTIVVANL